MQSSTPLDKPDAVMQDYDPRTRLASQGKRFANLLIDVAAYYVLTFVTGYTMALMGYAYLLLRNDLTPNLIGMLVLLSYYTITEAAFGRTLGKVITRCKVVNEQGHKPSFGQVFGRSFSRLIPFEAFSFLGNPVGWHDSISNTYVVNG